MFTRWVLPLVGLIMLALPACRMWSNPFDAQSFDDVQLTSMSPASEEYWRQERLRLVSDQQDKQIGLADAVRITEVPHNLSLIHI